MHVIRVCCETDRQLEHDGTADTCAHGRRSITAFPDGSSGGGQEQRHTEGDGEVGG